MAAVQPFYIKPSETFTDLQKLAQYANSAIFIYALTSGGEGDSERNLMMHPAERVAYAKVKKCFDLPTTPPNRSLAGFCRTTYFCAEYRLDQSLDFTLICAHFRHKELPPSLLPYASGYCRMVHSVGFCKFVAVVLTYLH